MYGLDLREALWGENPMGARRLLAHIAWLPEGSATQILAREYQWTQQDELLATIADLLSISNHYYLTSHMEQKEAKKLDAPALFPRPWEESKIEEPAPVQSSHDDVRAFFMGNRNDPVIWDAHGEGVRLNPHTDVATLDSEGRRINEG